MKALVVFAVLLMTLPALGQEVKNIDIQYVSIKDTIINQEIEKLIVAESEAAGPDNLFKKGFGYIDLYINTYTNSDTLARYGITPSLFGFRKKDPDSRYPPFYSYSGGRLVLVYVDALESALHLNYSTSSKTALRKRIDAFLEKPTDQTFYDMAGHKAFRDKHFRIDHFKFDAGNYIYIIKGKPPVIQRQKDAVR